MITVKVKRCAYIWLDVEVNAKAVQHLLLVTMSAARQAPAGGPTPQAPFFPFARYTSLVGVHTSLLLFVALFLPRTSLSDVLPASLLHFFPDAAQPAFTRGGDHPQSRFIETLTASPTSTVAWMCAGVGILQVWWAGWVRGWLVEYQASKLGGLAGDQEKNNENVAFNRFIDASGFTLVATLVLHCGLVVGGAPLTR
jgi:phosphatidylinositol glycan class F